VTIAYLALGANLGDRKATLDSAIESLDWGSVDVVSCSSVYETDPVGGPADQPWFFNMVIAVETTLGVRELFERCQAVEVALGRERDLQERWGPRSIDIDLLLFGSDSIDESGLVVPHPLMHERGFVLLPLVEIAPDVAIPGKGLARDLLETVGRNGVRQLA